ncbi:similar to Saccharomyces cerevisiae YBL037W APL3 Alpha-adaptin, large subunit of the clathrin associated protein complex (AP-2) [Maudiozyma barnettii]|uniref:AP-2 complex subunit alpha n=1 Tax=Maudiozyma barnettii TaxID=61262 RepID=A0A8H2VD71_9SACH|nr:Apl3p [Kazachstania barnettii]CAB4253093.1 similar to Saccharomyces cerevisiae YBL037W APL3 Alpha-adaptin, large subunit of the clathrin associated protein complex (AP-2) [Kazachstania barnettii]CAD1780372.1 similar to Saccharomyces cerevisiae YBL037W APL3 Alpha-adaptin, large subunit of the clathrin associated protein complex (AP-2) [Kazachstania barnettii]
MDRRKTFADSTVSNTGSNIKGLQLFIADLRASQQSEDQLKRIHSEIVKIKQHFNTSNKKGTSNGRILNNDKFDGYQRKKYVAKLAYIYITSNTTMLNDILFGLDEVVKLIKSNIFSEKFIGYMTLELLYRHKIVVERVNDEVVIQLINDISSSKDDFTELGLNFVGVTGTLTKALASNQDLVSEVFQVLRSPTSSLYLKKKSTLAFLTLLKSKNSILADDLQRKQLWIQRILSLLDDTDNYRLTLTTLPLVEYIAKNIDPSFFTRLVPQLSDILYKCVVIGGSNTGRSSFPDEYKFANMPNPWLITKIVSLLNVLIISPSETEDNNGLFESSLLHTDNIDCETLGRLRMCVMETINLGTRRTSDPMEKTVQNTILFSLINFASKLDPSHEAIVNSATALCELLNSNDINVRYLTLDSLIRLCSFSGKTAFDSIRGKNLDLIFHILNSERDSSIIRKVVDLLYTFTDIDNVKTIVEQLLSFILSSKHLSDPHLKSDIVIKAAILTENFSIDPSWYVSISLKILSLSVNTSTKDEEIWRRLCQIVVNNPQLQVLTCQKLIEYLRSNQTSEYIVKVAAFILGEYTYMISDNVPIPDLFNIFTEKYFTLQNGTKAMILTTMIKLYKCQPDIGSAVIKFYQLELNSLDIELQTRSYEYLKLIQISKMSQNLDLLDTLFQPLPPFNNKSNPLLKRLGSLPVASLSTMALSSSRSRSSSMILKNTSNDESDNGNIMQTTSQGTDVTVVPRPPPSRKTRSSSTFSELLNKNPVVDIKYGELKLSNNWREGSSRMFQFNQGILLSSPLLKILYKILVLEPTKLEITLTFVNQTEWDISALTSEIIASRTNNNPEYFLQNIQPPGSPMIIPHRKVEQKFEIVIRKPFSCNEAPVASIYFKCGGSVNTLNLRMGLGVTSTLSTNGAVTLTQFVKRWKTLSDAMGKEGEYQSNDIVVSLFGNDTPDTNLTKLTNIIMKMGFDVVEQTTLSQTLFLAGIVHTKTDGNFGCLLKLSYLDTGKLNITCKTTTGGPLAQYIVDCIIFAINK